ncbi:molybdopterin converting factor subunit 1 [Chitinophaga vietnamensis]|uniref:molybdopterin converting factor subunit 1 n=1 Tax=Chitinophaga vietnamensis TaxID=2593957 RepID=UPI001178BA0E|nr:molybdopterin converting factor subunit 1 [Chitinophaga vietnamensis]
MSLLLFGVARDITGSPKMEIPPEVRDVQALRAWLYHQYPALEQLKTMMIAVNREYAEDHVQIGQEDEIAIIPPVSGG